MYSRRPRNVILLVTDSLRYDSVFRRRRKGMKFPRRVQYMNNNGIQFTQARSAGCWTLPATASMFTGLLPHEHEATCRSRKVNSPIPSLAEILKENGYYTAQITANVATTHIFGLHTGFDRIYRIWDYIQPQFNSLYKLVLMMGKPRVRKLLFSKDGLSLKLTEDLRVGNCWVQNTHTDVFNMARRILAENEHQGKSTFLFLNLMESHFPYHVGPTFKLTGKGIRDRMGELSGLFHILNQSFLRSDSGIIPPHTLGVLRNRQNRSWRLIAGEVDEFIREIRNDQDNLVIFCSDHGDNFGDQGWIYHFGNVTDGGNRVPLIWFWDDSSGGQEISRPVSGRHVYGSILDACGISHSAPTLFDERADSVPIIEAFWYDSLGRTLSKYRHDQFCFVDNDRRYVYRDNMWLTAQTSDRRMEKTFEALPPSVDPIFECGMPKERRTYLQDTLSAFRAFSRMLSYSAVTA